MAQVRYVFVDWNERDIVSTSSWPGKDIMGESKYMPDKPGRRAQRLLALGYRYYGTYTGWNLTIINYDKQHDKR